MRKILLFSTFLGALLFLSACGGYRYTTYSYRQDGSAEWAAQLFVNKALEKCMTPNISSGSNYYSFLDLHPDNKYHRITYEGMTKITREIEKYLNKNYLVSKTVSYEYQGYDGEGRAFPNKNRVTKYWLGRGNTQIEVDARLYKDNRNSFSVYGHCSNFNRADLITIPSEKDYISILEDEEQFKSNLDIRSARSEKHGAENRAYAKAESARHWNALIAGANEGLKNWNDELRTQRSINHDIMVPGAPKRWEDMTDSERKVFAEDYKYKKQKKEYDTYKKRFYKSDDDGEVTLYLVSDTPTSGCKTCSTTQKIVMYASNGKQFVKYIQRYRERKSTLTGHHCQTFNVGCESPETIKRNFESLYEAQGATKLYKKVELLAY